MILNHPHKFPIFILSWFLLVVSFLILSPGQAQDNDSPQVSISVASCSSGAPTSVTVSLNCSDTDGTVSCSGSGLCDVSCSTETPGTSCSDSCPASGVTGSYSVSATATDNEGATDSDSDSGCAYKREPGNWSEWNPPEGAPSLDCPDSGQRVRSRIWQDQYGCASSYTEYEYERCAPAPRVDSIQAWDWNQDKATDKWHNSWSRATDTSKGWKIIGEYYRFGSLSVIPFTSSEIRIKTPKEVGDDVLKVQGIPRGQYGCDLGSVKTTVQVGSKEICQGTTCCSDFTDLSPLTSNSPSLNFSIPPRPTSFIPLIGLTGTKVTLGSSLGGFSAQRGTKRMSFVQVESLDYLETGDLEKLAEGDEFKVDFFEKGKPWTTSEVIPLAPFVTSQDVAVEPNSFRIRAYLCENNPEAFDETRLDSDGGTNSRFTFTFPPSIAHIKPNWGIANFVQDKVTIWGNNLEDSQVTFTKDTVGTVAEVLSSSSYRVEARVPQEAQTGPIKVCTPYGCVTSREIFYVQDRSPVVIYHPEILSVFPNLVVCSTCANEYPDKIVWPAGIKITGRNFRDDWQEKSPYHKVLFRAEEVDAEGKKVGASRNLEVNEYLSWSDKEIIVYPPAKPDCAIPATGCQALSNKFLIVDPITISTQDGSVTNRWIPGEDRPPPLPEIFSFSPSCGKNKAGGQDIAIVIKGYNFGPSQGSGWVTINNFSSPVLTWNNETIIAKVPDPGPPPQGIEYWDQLTGPLKVQTDKGLEVQSLAPFIGSNLEDGHCPFENQYTSLNPAPQIQTISQVEEYVGEDEWGKEGGLGKVLTIFGQHFGSGQRASFVLFNDTRQVKVVSWNDSLIEVYIPFDAVSGDLSVFAWTGKEFYTGKRGLADTPPGGGWTLTGTPFRVLPTIQKLILPKGVVGSLQHIYGSDFCNLEGCTEAGKISFGNWFFPVSFPEIPIEPKPQVASFELWTRREILAEVPNIYQGEIKIVTPDDKKSLPQQSKPQSDQELIWYKQNHFYEMPTIDRLYPFLITNERAKKIDLQGTGFFGNVNNPYVYQDPSINADLRMFADPIAYPWAEVYKTKIRSLDVSQGYRKIGKEENLEHIYEWDETGQKFLGNYNKSTSWTLFGVSPGVSDALYFGSKKRFEGLVFNLANPLQAQADFAWEYWNGGSWQKLASLVDGTAGFTKTGRNKINWSSPSLWIKKEVNSYTVFWIRCRIKSLVSWVSSAKQGGETVKMIPLEFLDLDKKVSAWVPERFNPEKHNVIVTNFEVLSWDEVKDLAKYDLNTFAMIGRVKTGPDIPVAGEDLPVVIQDAEIVVETDDSISIHIQANGVSEGTIPHGRSTIPNTTVHSSQVRLNYVQMEEGAPGWNINVNILPGELKGKDIQSFDLVVANTRAGKEAFGFLRIYWFKEWNEEQKKFYDIYPFYTYNSIIRTKSCFKDGIYHPLGPGNPECQDEAGEEWMRNQPGIRVDDLARDPQIGEGVFRWDYLTVQYPIPEITNISPREFKKSGKSYQTQRLTLQGNYLAPTARIRVGSYILPTSVAGHDLFIRGNTAYVQVPVGRLRVGTYPVEVVNPDGQRSKSLELRILK